jgi:hypothetical protein
VNFIFPTVLVIDSLTAPNWPVRTTTRRGHLAEKGLARAGLAGRR